MNNLDKTSRVDVQDDGIIRWYAGGDGDARQARTASEDLVGRVCRVGFGFVFVFLLDDLVLEHPENGFPSSRNVVLGPNPEQHECSV